MKRKLSEEVLYETEHYEVVVGESTDRENPGPCYHIVNKETGVPEVETKIFPQAKVICSQISKAHEAPVEDIPPSEVKREIFQH